MDIEKHIKNYMDNALLDLDVLIDSEDRIIVSREDLCIIIEDCFRFVDDEIEKTLLRLVTNTENIVH